MRPEDFPAFILKADTQVTQIVYGGKPCVWIAKKGEDFPFNYEVSRNASYVVVQSGLNNYIFQTCDIETVLQVPAKS